MYSYHEHELVVDNFAGGGGASTGIELAIGRSVDIAINHDPKAISMHKVNHPQTIHYCESVFDIDPVQATFGKPIALAWFSPDCCHFSRARGATPVKKDIRGLAWVVVRWALLTKPRVIILENVEEFKTWGPTIIDNNGNEYPDPSRVGETFNAFVSLLSTGIEENHPALEEVSEFLKIDKGSREFNKIIKGLGYKIDFKELRANEYGAPTIRKRFFMVMRNDNKPIVWPLPTHGEPDDPAVKDGFLLPFRTAYECIDFSLDCPSIFDRKKSLADNTLKRIARGIFRFVINNPKSFIVRYINSKNAISNVFLAKNYGGNYTGPGSSIDEPIHTITATDHNSLVTSNLIDLRESSQGKVRVFLLKYYGNDKECVRLDEPLHTITAKDRFSIVQTNLNPISISEKDRYNAWWCARFLEDYYDRKEQNSLIPTLREQYIIINGEYALVDIRMRMLQPNELYKAQGFPDWYVFERDYYGLKFTKKEQVAKCGNSVCPQMAEALVRSNLPELCVRNTNKEVA